MIVSRKTRKMTKMLSKLDSKSIHSVSPEEAPKAPLPNIVFKHISELTDHPLNDIIYDKPNDNRDKLRASLIKSKNKTGIANKESCKIDPNGVIYSGHRRKWASEEDETGVLGYLKCEYIEHTFDPESLNDPTLEQKEADLLDEFNEPDIIRSQTSWPVVLRKYNYMNNIKYKRTGKYFIPKERNLWCAEKCGFTPDAFKKMVEIYDVKRNDLIDKVEREGYSIHKAHTEALNIQPVSKLKYDPDRKNWVEYFKENPKCMDRVVDYANEMLKQHLDINIGGKKIPEDKIHGHEQNMLSTNLSNFYMSAVSLVLEEEGFCSITPREEAGLPDVRILNLSKPGYHFERLEVKVTSFKGHGSKTYISAGPGANRIVPHTFLLVVYDPDTKRQMVVLSDLTKEDWTSNSKNTKCEMGMNIWADNHLDDCVFFHGDGFIDSRNLFNMNLKKVVTYNNWLLAKRKIVDLKNEIS